jgi:hypothetical protein
MCPQFVDFDADGYTDIITATFEGTAFIVRGSAAGWQSPERLVDAQGRHIVLSLFYDMKANKYDNADRSPEGTTNPEDHCVSAMAMDWDADGDYDLLLGAYEGRLYLQRNEGAPGEPSFTGENELLEAGGEPFNVPGGLTAPRQVDWDDDGVTDLVCGGFEGGVYFYRNAGAAGAPKFEAPKTLIEPGVIAHDGPKFPNKGVYADPVDYDGDGDLDLLVGGYAQWQPEAPELTEADEARIVELTTAIDEVQMTMQKLYEAVEKEAEAAASDEEKGAIFERMTSTEEFQTAQAEASRLYEELSVLQPPPKREAGVWLYRRR